MSLQNSEFFYLNLVLESGITLRLASVLKCSVFCKDTLDMCSKLVPDPFSSNDKENDISNKNVMLFRINLFYPEPSLSILLRG